MSGNFKDGDVVQLKSGSPKMTISGENALTGGYICVWFVGTEVKSYTFVPESLILVNETP